jgi:hypothetical protein
MITFELYQSEKDKEKSKITKDIWGKDIAQKIIIRKDGNIVGHIFSPSGSSNDTTNAIQICGFTEAFDLWGCGIFKGFKDIQLLFDEGIMGGIDNKADLKECMKCYRKPCQCENKDLEQPFNIKRESMLSNRVQKECLDGKQSTKDEVSETK